MCFCVEVKLTQKDCWNFMRVLYELPHVKDFRITSNGRIVKKTPERPQSEHRDNSDIYETRRFIEHSLSFCHLNVGGWTINNHDLRRKLIRSIRADIVSVCETQLSGSNYGT